MKLTCPSCGFENESEDAGASDPRGLACRSCGASLRAPARRAGEYDGYAVGRRVLKVAPLWVLLCVVGFVALLFALRWASRPLARGDEFRNEATNQPPAPTPTPTPTRARDVAAVEPKTPPGDAGEATAATEPDAPSAEEEAASFSVQVGAFDDRSDANELVSRLRAKGFDARVVESEDSRRFRFQVRSGLFKTREEAARLSAQLRSKGVAGQTVIVEPAGGKQK
jgi:cell division septation protein DedD